MSNDHSTFLGDHELVMALRETEESKINICMSDQDIAKNPAGYLRPT
jgi:hypothetical protein